MSGNTDENGYTFDGHVNSHVTSRTFRSRLDRVYFYPGASVRAAFAASSQAVLDSIQIVGNEPISTKLWPSDHFGLLASFDFDTGDSDDDAGRPTTTAAASSASNRTRTTTTPTSGVKHEAQAARGHRLEDGGTGGMNGPAAKKAKPGSSKDTALTIE